MLICGVDEVGRGALAGPVLACAVLLPSEFSHLLIKDSKTLTPKLREELAQLIKEQAIDWQIGTASPREIEKSNILEASLLAMRRAIKKLKTKDVRSEEHTSELQTP